MARVGFIRDKLDVKLLILYLLDRVVAPIDFASLTDLSMCDSGVDYFIFAEAVSELLESKHIVKNNELYSITEKGHSSSIDCESSLCLVIRRRCDERLSPLNARLRRDAQVQASVTQNKNGSFTLSLSLDDDMGNLMNVSLTAVSETQCDQMARYFQANPEKVYRTLLFTLLQDETK
jgi:hypothetical protein